MIHTQLAKKWAGLAIGLVALFSLSNVAFGFTDVFTFSPADFDTATEEMGEPPSPYYKIKFTSSFDADPYLAPDVGWEEGLPNLPCFQVTNILPPGTKIDSVYVVSYQKVLLANLDTTLVSPTQPNDPTLDGYDFHPFQHADTNLYMQYEIYPGYLVQKGTSGIWKTAYMGSFTLYPVQYQPQTGKVWLCTEIQVEIQTGGQSQLAPPVGQGPIREDIGQIDPSAMKGLVHNPDMVYPWGGYPADNWTHSESIVDTEIPILHIGAEVFSDTVDLLIQFERHHLGWNAAFLSTEDIDFWFPGAYLKEKVKNAIQHYYETYGTAYIQLVGDHTVVPVWYTYHRDYTNGQPDIDKLHIGDIVYSDFNGEWDVDGDLVYGEPGHDNPDIYPEVYIARLPFSTDSLHSLGNAVHNLIEYLQNGPTRGNRTTPWHVIASSDQLRDREQHLAVASAFPDWVVNDASSLIEMPTGYDPNPWGPFGITVETYLVNQPVWFFNQQSHGSPPHNVPVATCYNAKCPQPPNWKSYLSSGNYGGHHGCIKEIANTQYGGIVDFSISCCVGSYDQALWVGSECMLVAFLSTRHADVSNISHGRLGWVVSSYLLQRAYWEHIFDFENEYFYQGPAFVEARLCYPTNRYENYDLVNGGNPAMAIFREELRNFCVDFPEVVGRGWQTIRFVVSDCETAEPVPDATIALTCAETIYVGRTNGEGIWEKLMYVPQNVIRLTFTVTKYSESYVPAMDTIRVADDTPPTGGQKSSASGERAVPIAFSLERNYPNPFNSQTLIPYAIPEERWVTLTVYNILGEKVRSLVEAQKPAGYYTAIWDGRNDAGVLVSSGIYLYRLKAGNQETIKRMSLLR